MARIAAALVSVLILVPALSNAQGTGASDDRAIRDVIGAYAAARDAQDPKATQALFVADADQLVSSGEWRRGRDALVTGAMASSARTAGTRTLDVESVRIITGDVAIVDARYEIRDAAGGVARRMWSTFVLVRHDGAWRISAIRNMLPAAP